MNNLTNHIELKDTIELMTSNDYKDRFRAEYWQLIYRKNKIDNIIENWDCDKYGAPSYLILQQEQIMDLYINVLIQRAIIEDIDLL